MRFLFFFCMLIVCLLHFVWNKVQMIVDYCSLQIVLYDIRMMCFATECTEVIDETLEAEGADENEMVKKHTVQVTGIFDVIFV